MAGRIMVIEDEASLLDLYRELLTDEGYTVVAYAAALHDVDEVERQAPNLIVLDYRMGTEPYGRQLLGQLRSRPTTAAIPVILSTADQRAAEALGDDPTLQPMRILFKPFDIDTLLACVGELLELGRSGAERPTDTVMTCQSFTLPLSGLAMVPA
jgi:CheY-like chemotaxis protein